MSTFSLNREISFSTTPGDEQVLLAVFIYLFIATSFNFEVEPIIFSFSTINIMKFVACFLPLVMFVCYSDIIYRELDPLPYATWPQTETRSRTVQEVTYLEENIIITVDISKGGGCRVGNP